MSSPTRPLICAVAMFFNMFLNMFQPWWLLFLHLPKTKCGTTVSQCRGAKERLHRTYTRTRYHTVCRKTGWPRVAHLWDPNVQCLELAGLRGRAESADWPLHVFPRQPNDSDKDTKALSSTKMSSDGIKGTKGNTRNINDLFWFVSCYTLVWLPGLFIFLQFFACLHVGCTNHLASGSIFAHCGETQVLQPMSLGQDRLDCLSTDSETF
jgi:hypothetical protein